MKQKKPSFFAFFNGKILPENDVQISVDDRSYLYGEGIFETMRATQGQVPLFPEHWNRLNRGISFLKYSFNVSFQSLQEMILKLLRRNQLSEAYVRLHLSRKNKVMGFLHPSEDYHLLILIRPLEVNHEKFPLVGLKATVVEEAVVCPHPFRTFKSSDYFHYGWALQRAHEQGYEEALIKNFRGNLVEGATTNLFLFNGRQWVTPPVSEGALEGVGREFILTIFKKNQESYLERPLSLDDLSAAQEAFLSNALRGIRPLISVDQKTIGDGSFRRTQELELKYQTEIQKRLGI